MKIININENYGECVGYDSVEEMADAIANTECLEMPDCTESDLIEGADYEYVK